MYKLAVNLLDMKKSFFLATVCLLVSIVHAQQFYQESKSAKKWVNKQFKKLSTDEKIAQLMIIRAHSNLGKDHIDQVTKLIQEYNVGGLCFFQGGPLRQALLTNYYQNITKTPLMICIDGEWGVGMRLDSVINYPRQLMMGATQDKKLIYEFGKAVGNQCKRMGIHVNYAPDIDVNNNPNNPVINDRSFGEDKYKVALYGIAYMQGMQNVNVMACGKHFPGHGDVAVDSHYDLPVINKSRRQLDSLELYPFRELINAGVGSMMIAHLFVPSIDTIANQATSLSNKNVTGLLKNELNYKGIIFTDGLGMKGITKFYPAGEASAQALIAGNDMLCLPEDVPAAIEKVKEAIKAGKLSWTDLNARVKKILLAKYNLGLHNKQVIDTTNLLADLNEHTNRIKALLAKNAITHLKQSNTILLPLKATRRIAYVSIGAAGENTIIKQLKNDVKADVYLFGSKAAIGAQLMDDKNVTVPADKTDVNTAQQFLNSIYAKGYDAIVVGMHNYSRRPANDYGLSKAAIYLVTELQKQNNAMVIYFGNPYALKFSCSALNVSVAYEDDDITQAAVADWLQGKLNANGKLPVTVCENFKFGDGIVYQNNFPANPLILNSAKTKIIDSIANDAIAKGAAPGCVVLVAKDGKIAYHKAFGYTNTDKKKVVTNDMVFDLASVTKISATTVGIMKLYEEGKVDLNKTLGDYLPWVKGTDKAGLIIQKILLHQAGLNPFIPFYKEVIDSATGNPLPNFFSTQPTKTHMYRVAENLYLKNSWQDTLHKRILTSKLTASDKYVYSDNDFIFLGKIIEAVSGKLLNDYVQHHFYEPLNMITTTYLPRQKISLEEIVPTEVEKHFRQQHIWGDVHDEGAAMFGGVAGHAGLFSNAYDLAKLYQMLLNGGEMDGKRYLQKSTIDLFTSYQSTISRRGLGFDKPEKDNASRKEPYPAAKVSEQTYGHTGFTGTCVWVDPKNNLIYIFLSNRVNPTRNNNKLGQLSVRGKIQDAVYQAFGL
ncbi:MAG: glycoside hydrolase family 3 N-terminal domain-containing protein [Chitinophagaceae bacterium]